MSFREAFLQVLEQYLGTPYRWGGDDPSGFDCSGLMLEGLQAVGRYGAGDTTAAGLRSYLVSTGGKDVPIGLAQPGCLVFYGTGAITHVEAVWQRIGDRVLMLGARGGGSATMDTPILPTDSQLDRIEKMLKNLSHLKAAEQNAYVKIRPPRADVLAVIDPWPV